jgi:hypothetical protein
MSAKSVFRLGILTALVAGSCVLVAVPGPAPLNTIVYPAENPVFSISFPNGWLTETDGELLHAMPEDSSVYLGLWALEDAKTVDAALDAVDEVVSSLVTQLKVGEVDTLVINGIAFLSVDGKGIDTEGDRVNVSAALFSPDQETIFILVYYATPAAEAHYENDLVSILKSIRGK